MYLHVRAKTHGALIRLSNTLREIASRMYEDVRVCSSQERTRETVISFNYESRA